MKTMKYLLLLLSLACITAGRAQNIQLSLETDEFIAPGNKASMTLYGAISTGVKYCAYQFDVTLPEGVGINIDNTRLLFIQNKTTNHQLEIAKLSSGNVYRVICYSNDNSALRVQENRILELRLEAGDVSDGAYQGSISNIIFTRIVGGNSIVENLASIPFTLNVSTLVVIIANDYSREYGENNPTLEYSVMGGEMIGIPTLTCEATKNSPVATYPIVVNRGTVQNLNAQFVNGNLTVTYAPLTIAAGTYTVTERDPMPDFTLTYTGFKNGETKDVLITQPSVTCPVTNTNTPGEYDVIVGGARAANYTISYVRGKLIINPLSSYTLRYIVDGELYKSYTLKVTDVITPEPDPVKEGYTFSGWSDIPTVMPDHDVTVTGSFSVNSYKLTYMLDGQVYKTTTLNYGTPITPEPDPVKEGYTFSGWSNIPATMPSHDVTVTGTFGINTYKLSYIVDGQVYKTYQLSYGTAITPEPNPVKEGYTFSGWSDIPATMPAHDVSVTGSFSINKYNLKYMVDNQVYKTLTLNYGTNISPEPAPTKEGYTFSGWSDIPATMPAHDVIVTGTFSVNSYKLTYIVDGQTYKTLTLKYGATITPEANPVKEGYSFSGWSDIPATMPAHDVTVTGTFSINSYKLTYVVDGQTYKSLTLNYGAAITPEPALTKEGYTFSGWSSIPATMPAHDVTVTGSFAINTYRLTYFLDGEVYKTFSYKYGAAITPEANPVREGYSFSGWSDIPATMPAHDVSVTGTFTTNKYVLTYIVDGQEYKTYEIDFGSVITPEPAPVKEGYTFSGWSDIPETMPAHVVIVTGSFHVNYYKLTYMVDGVEYRSYTLNYGTPIVPEPEPTLEGHAFSGWSEIPATMPSHDVIVTGTFDTSKYKLTYMVDGQEYKSYEVLYGSVIVPEPNPEKEGYTFTGWSGLPEMMPAHDVVVNGSFNLNKYKLTYIVDEEVYKEVEVDFGAEIIPEPAPVKEGHTFSGWSEIPATMPANDVTVTGTFVVNKYKLTYMVDEVEYKSYEIDYGTTIDPEPSPVKEGYTFSGWIDLPETMPAHDVVIYASFTLNTYKLTYMVDDEEYKVVSLDFGVVITPEPDPTKEGHTFSGWSEIPETMPAHDVIVTGTFIANKYHLTYLVDGEVYKAYVVTYGDVIIPEPDPVKEGFSFSGWLDLPETMPAHDVEVHASFSINSYKLTYMLDDEEYKVFTLEYGSAITPVAAPSKEGHTFSGWEGVPQTMPAHDVTVTGSFLVNQYKLYYIVDGAEYKTYDIDFGALLVPEAEPVKEGYLFSGWSAIPETMPASDVIVVGSFTIGQYKLTYLVDGEEYKSYVLDFATPITPETLPTKEGHTFSGWSDIPVTMPAHDVTVTGSFTVNQYILLYILDGAEYKTYQVAYGTILIPEEEPVKEGYTFSGWNGLPETMPARLVVVTGSFSINTYTLTYMIGEEVYKTVEYQFGAAIIPEPKPTEGYSSFEWIDVPEVMPAHDVTVYASYEVIDNIASVILKQGVKAIYTPNGKKLDKLQKGMNVIIMNDGTRKKVVVK